MKLTDEMIAKAAQDYEQSVLDSLSVTEHAFSPAFERRMKRLIRRQEQPVGYLYLRRAVCAILAIVLCVGAFLMLHPEARAAVTEWLRRQFAFSTYYHPSEDAYISTAPSREKPVFYDLGQLPDGCSLSLRHVSNEGGFVTYFTDTRKEMTLKYFFASESCHVYISNEGYDVRYVNVHDNAADLYLAVAEDSPNKLVWSSDDGSVIFVLTAPYGESEMLCLAENVCVGKDDREILHYDLGWLPERYHFAECYYYGDDGSVIYHSNNGSVSLSYDYNSTLGSMYGDFEEKTVTVGCYTAKLYTYKDKRFGSYLVWVDEEKNVLFKIYSGCDLDELMKIAENIVPVQ